MISEVTGYRDKEYLKGLIKDLIFEGMAYTEGKSLRLISYQKFCKYFGGLEADTIEYYYFPDTKVKGISNLIIKCVMQEHYSEVLGEMCRGPKGCNTLSNLTISEKQIAGLLNVSRSTVHNVLNRLKDLGEMTITRNPNITLGKSLSTPKGKKGFVPLSMKEVQEQQRDKIMNLNFSYVRNEMFLSDLELQDWKEKKNQFKVFKFNDLIVQGVPNTIGFIN
jgi:hypothetical protein